MNAAGYWSRRAVRCTLVLVLLCLPGRASAQQPGSCTGDLNGDAVVDATDLALLLGNWGPCPPPPVCGDHVIEPPEQCDPPDGVICSDECQLLCTLEAEADCGQPEDVVNGGCGSNPIVFSPVWCGEVFCGTAAWDGLARDTDWYEIEVSEPTEVVWTVTAEFALLIGVVDTGGSGDCFDAQGLDPFAFGLAGEETSVSACLAPGTWWLYVSPELNGPPFECGSGYVAELSCHGSCAP